MGHPAVHVPDLPRDPDRRQVGHVAHPAVQKHSEAEHDHPAAERGGGPREPGTFQHCQLITEFNNNDIKAFSILGVSIGIKWERVQEKFKKLVKKFHPDMNAGNKKYEDKLKIITLAYTQLKNTYRAKIDY